MVRICPPPPAAAGKCEEKIFGTLTQGSSSVATAGLEADTPLEGVPKFDAVYWEGAGCAENL